MANYNDFTGDTFGLNGSPKSGDSSWGPSYGSDAAAGFTSSTTPRVTTQPVSAPQGPPTNGFSPTYSGATPATTTPGPSTPASTGSSFLPGDVYAQDALARNVYSDLQAAGHDVKWNGNQLMVDGRPYDLGSASTGTVPQATPSVPTGTPPGAVDTSGMNPQLVALFQKYGIAPTGRGTGITDIANWNDYLSKPGADANFLLGRLEQDFQGTGPDQGGGGSAPGGDWGASYGAILGAGGGGQVPSFSTPSAPWDSNGPGVYTPGAITFDDIPNFTSDQLLGEMRSGAAGAPLENLITDIEQHPTSLDDHAVDTMKAQMKDTLAEQGQFEDQDLKGQGAALGIGDSPWLAAQRAAARRSTDQAIASGNQNLDIQAAQTRAADKRAAAGVGQAFANSRSAQVMDSVNAGLQRASLTGNRMALRESVAQAAAASRQSASQIMTQWLQQNAGLKLDYTKLSTQNTQFLEDLMMRTQQLSEQRSEFAASYGLNAEGLSFAESQAPGATF